MGNLCHLVISEIAIRYQTSRKTLEEALRPFLVLKDPDMLIASIFAGEYPHPGFGGGRLILLLQHLHYRLVRVDHRLLQKLLLHVPEQGLQPDLRTLDHPVMTSATVEADARTLAEIMWSYPVSCSHFCRHR